MIERNKLRLSDDLLDSAGLSANLTNYIKGFSTRAREIIENFGFEEHIQRRYPFFRIHAKQIRRAAEHLYGNR